MTKYFTVYRTILQDLMQYRFNAIMNWVLKLYVIVVPFALWGSILGPSQQTVAGYDMKGIMTYVILFTVMAPVILANNLHFEIESEIFTGNINKYLSKPIDYRRYMFVKNVARRSFECLLIIVPFLVIVLILQAMGYVQVNPFYPNIFYFLISTVLGILLSYLIFFALGLSAFWIVKCGALFYTFDQLLSFFSGQLFPLDMFPQLSVFFKFMPFEYQVYLPVKLYIGGLTNQQIFTSLSIQVAWVLVMLVVANVMWHRGIKKHTAIGG